MNDTYTVYIKTDAQSNIIAVDSSAFLTDTTGWTSLDEGAGDKYHHAQGNYFDKPIMTALGIYRYAIEDGQAVEKLPEVIAAEEAALPPPPPTEAELLVRRMDTLDGAFMDFLINVVPLIGTGV